MLHSRVHCDVSLVREATRSSDDSVPHIKRDVSRGLLLLVVVIMVCLCDAGAAASGPADALGAAVPGTWSTGARDARAPAGTFVSMVPACACGWHTELELFAIASGRMLRKLVPVPTKGFEGGSTPAAANDGYSSPSRAVRSAQRAAHIWNVRGSHGFLPQRDPQLLTW